MSRTVFVTGASGFLAKHIVLQLLQKGDSVVGSLRSPKRADEVRAAITDAGGSVENLRFVTLDLTSDDGWADAMTGCDALIHTASPFPLAQPKDEMDLIRPAVEGTLRALKAAVASGVPRVVLTSSIAAVSWMDPPTDRKFDERDWSDPDAKGISAYSKSKTLAERAAWDFVKGAGASLRLTTINPAFVLGCPLDPHPGSSISLISRMLAGKDPMVPNLGFSVVDVEDVAEAHVRALDVDASIGQRIIAASDTMWFVDMTKALKAEYPDRRIPTRVAPTFVLRFLALFDASIRGILPSLGRDDQFSNAKAHDMLGINFTPARDALLKAARYLVKNDLV
ncbi:MAG: aldehyde reductase [Deltaproteobacteria bacterium]